MMENYERELLLKIAEDVAYMKGIIEGIQKYEGQIGKNTKDINDVGKIARENRSDIKNQQEEIDDIKKKFDSQNGTFIKIATGLFTAMGSAIAYLAHKLGII